MLGGLRAVILFFSPNIHMEARTCSELEISWLKESHSPSLLPSSVSGAQGRLALRAYPNHWAGDGPFCRLSSIDVPLGGWRKWLYGQVLVQGKFSNLDLDSD